MNGTGVSLGVMLPDPVPAVFEQACRKCGAMVRERGLWHLGEEGRIQGQCLGCGEPTTITAAARGLDS